MERVEAAVAREALLIRMNDDPVRFWGQESLRPVIEKYSPPIIKELEQFQGYRRINRPHVVAGGHNLLPANQCAIGLPAVERLAGSRLNGHVWVDVFVRGLDAESRSVYFTNETTSCYFFHDQVVPDYNFAFQRIQDFEEEVCGWDGYEGKPASSDTAAVVRKFLYVARGKALSRPSLTLSNSGAVSVVWKGSTNYVTVNFKGADKFVALVIANGKNKLALEGAVGTLPAELEDYLVENFKEDV